MRTATIIALLESYAFPLHSEAKLQQAIEKQMTQAGIPFIREYRLGTKDRVDFFSEGLAIEIKIHGQPKAIYRQCKSYCEYDEVKALVLVTNRTMGFPKEVNGKPCFVVKLGRSWL